MSAAGQGAAARSSELLVTEDFQVNVALLPEGADPDVLIVPLAAFDNKGHRIGYGAGYYDMTINRLRVLKQVTAIGFAYAAQQVAVVPIETHDARLDYVLTEREVIKCRK